jgi:hypothetical protein
MGQYIVVTVIQEEDIRTGFFFFLPHVKVREEILSGYTVKQN